MLVCATILVGLVFQGWCWCLLGWFVGVALLCLDFEFCCGLLSSVLFDSGCFALNWCLWLLIWLLVLFSYWCVCLMLTLLRF